MQTRDTFAQTYAYNAGGQLLSQNAPGDLHLKFAYNDRSLLSKVSGGFGAEAGAIFSGIRYDHRGATVKTDARNGTSTYAFYDNRARLAGMVSGKTDELPSYAPNLNYKSAPLSGAFQQLAYTRTPTGLLKSIDDVSLPVAGLPRFDAQYQYDRLYQLTGASTADGRIDYAYDTIQNLVRRTTQKLIEGALSDKPIDGLVSGDFKYGERGNGPNQITSTADGRFDYNAVGQMISYNGFDLYFDVEGRLVKAHKPGGTLIQYHYDDTGAKKLAILKRKDGPQRVYRYVFGNYQLRDGKQTWFIGGGQGQAEITEADGLSVDLYLLDELADYVHTVHDSPSSSIAPKKPLPAEYMDLDGDGDLLFDNDDLKVALDAYWTGQPVGEKSRVWRYTHKDHLGGNTVVTDSAGDVVSSLRYHPYGKIAQRTGQKPVYGFAGGEIEEEEELGLIQFGARWYAPEVGRWVSADPLFLESPTESVSKTLESGLYSYALNNPINGIDPTGLSEKDQTCSESDEYDALLDDNDGQSTPDEPLEQAATASPATPKKSKSPPKTAPTPKKDTTEGSTVVASIGGNATWIIDSTGVYLNYMVDWESGDIGFSITQPIALNPATEAGLQASIVAGDATVDELVTGSDWTVSAGVDVPGTDLGGGVVVSRIFDNGGNSTATMGGINGGFGVGDGMAVDMSIGKSITYAGGHVNAYQISQGAVPIMERMIEDPVEGMYEAWAPIADMFDIMGILE